MQKDGYTTTMKGTADEARLQQECYVWFHNTFPKLRGLLCYNLNNSKDQRTGAINRSLGLQAGRSDLVLYFQGRAIMIEMKTPSGKQSPAKKDWQTLIEQQGFRYEIARSLDEFKAIIHEQTKYRQPTHFD